jgi:hypothetical protein
MKRVGDQSQRMHGVADEELKQEEHAVDGQQDLDPVALGERHIRCRDTGCLSFRWKK